MHYLEVETESRSEEREQMQVDSLDAPVWVMLDARHFVARSVGHLRMLKTSRSLQYLKQQAPSLQKLAMRI